MLHGLPRRSAAIVATALLTTTLSSCGFDLATNRVNTISSGINDREGEVDVLGAVIISGAPDTGVFVASLNNASTSDPVSLTDLTGDVTSAEAVEPTEVAPQAIVNLFETGGVPLAGTIGLGDFINVELTFDNGQTTKVNVPVVRPCFEYDPAKFPGLELPGAAGEKASADEGGDESSTESHSEDETTQLTDPYSCVPTEPKPLHGESEE